MPIRTYTVGDEIRLEVEFVCAANVKTITLLFRERENPHITITLYDDPIIIDTKPSKEKELGLFLKTFQVELVTLVDIDHVFGTYDLETIGLETKAGAWFSATPPQDPVSFRIVDDATSAVESINISFMDTPYDE